jgi:predicted RNA-binding protein with PUA-like domain
MDDIGGLVDLVDRFGGKMTASHWIMKSEPNEFSITNLKNSPGQTAYWDGVRNYQARNFLRDKMRVQDHVLFYHSVVKPAVVGTARIVKSGYPDFTAWDPQNKHFDPKSTLENPIWYMVDIRFEMQFAEPISLAKLRTVPGLENMMLLRKGMRLSIQPVTPKEFDIIVSLGKLEDIVDQLA